MKTEDLLTDLMQLEDQLEALPDEVALSSRARARIRSQVMARAYQGQPAGRSLLDRLADGFGAAFTPRMLTRPVGAALSVVVAVALAGSTTVSAAMESLPGDGLYPVKTAYEQSCLVLAGSEDSRAQCYLWMASSRVIDIERAADAGRLDAIEKSVESYGVSIGHALTVAAVSKQGEKMQEQVAAVQTSFRELYEKAPEAVRPLLPVPLTAQGATATVSNPTEPNTETKATQPVTENHPGQPPVDGGFIDEAPSVAAAPPGSSWIQDKTGAGSTPVSTKDLPISTPAVTAQPLDPAPVKGAPGPATEPRPTKNDGVTPVEPEKSEPEAATTPAQGPSIDAPPSDSAMPNKENSGTATPPPAQEGKPSIVVQGTGSISLKQ